MATNYVSLLFLNSIIPISIQLHSSRFSSKSNHIHNKLKSHLLYILDRLVSLMSFIIMSKPVKILDDMIKEVRLEAQKYTIVSNEHLY